MVEITEAEFERMFDISVLVVDNDTTTLYIVAGILRTWGYKVVTATSGHEALKTLREFAGMFDLVITDLYMQGMNGFQLQNQIKREFQLPVILMSEDRRTSVMSKGLANGASFFIAKPVKKDDLRHVWQYVVAARKHKFLFNDHNLLLGDDHQFSLSSSSHHHHPLVNSAAASNNLLVLTNNDHDDDDDGDHNNSNTNNNEQIRNKSNGKRRCNNDNVDDEEFGGGQRKKPKVVWTTALHNRFLLAIRQIGMNKAVPKKILELMNVPGLTRENVASHLQKYRIFLKKVAERGLIDGLSDRALRSRFATGLPIALIKSIKKSFAHHHHPYTSSLTTTTLPSTLTNYRLPPSNNYSNVTTTNNLLHNSPHHHQPKYHNNYPTNLQNHPKPQYHQRTPVVPLYNNNINGIINNDGFMTSANALVANGGGGGSNNIGMMNLSNYGASMGNHSYSGSYNNYGDNINKNGKALVPYGSSVVQRKNTAATATATAANYNSDYYPAAAASNYGNYSGIQLNNNASSFMATTTTGMDQRGVNDINGSFGNYMGGNSDNNISFGGGLINNNNNADKAAATILNTATKENSNISVAPPILAEQTNIGITGNYNIAAGDDDDDQFDDENEWFIVNNPLSENEECLLDENFTDLFMMLDSMNLLNENGENGGGNSDEPLDFDFPTTPFDVEKCLQQFQGVDDEHVSPLTSSEGSSIAQPNKSPTSTDENSDKVLSDDGMFPNLDPIDWHLVDKANSSPAELDWDIDLIESLFGEGDLNKVAS